MRVPLEWLREYVTVTESAQEVATRLTMGGLEVEGIEEAEDVRANALRIGATPEEAEAAAALAPVLDVYITPNRGDCLSLVGVARELAALYDLPLNMPAPPPSEPGGEAGEATSVTIAAPELCSRYAARLTFGVSVTESPLWLRARLYAAGQRAINNIVDVTNYVMLELGQPLHAFDFDCLHERRIVVRRAEEGETLETLDGETRALSPSMLVIADGRRPVAVAGIMGGADSEVSEKTTRVLFESAHFNALSIRRASRALALRTEASYRFERVVGPEIVRWAVDRACELLTATGQPEAVSGVVDVMPDGPPRGRDVTLRVSRAAQLLGMEITPEVALDCLRRLSMDAEREGDTITIHVPPRRADLTLEEDLIEEIGRIYGYENIPETLPIGATSRGGDSDLGRFISRVKGLLAGAGLQEVVTHSLTAPWSFNAPGDETRDVTTRNALSTEISTLRRSLVPTMLTVVGHNVRQGQSSLALFEVGRVWQNEGAGGEIVPHEYVAVGGLLMGPVTPTDYTTGSKPALPADYALLRGVVDHLLSGLQIEGALFVPIGDKADALPAFHPGRTAFLYLGEGEPPCGVVGELHPRVLENVEAKLRHRVVAFEVSLDALMKAAPEDGRRYRSLSRFPSVSRDLAPRVAEATPYNLIEFAVEGAAIPFLESFRLVDVFQGEPLPEGIKSLTLNFTFRAPDRTLGEAEVNEALTTLRARLAEHCGAGFAG